MRRGELAEEGERLVEVALDLHHPGTVGDRLPQLPGRDLPLGHDDQRRDAGGGRVSRERGRGVSGRERQ